MTDHKAQIDQSDTPEDVATLYAWANLHGAKYRDFSASRALTREKARQRVQEAMAEERERSGEKSETAPLTDAQRAAEVARAAEASRAAEATREAQLVAQRSAQQSTQQAEWLQPGAERRTGPPISSHSPTVPPGGAGGPSQIASPAESRGYSPINALRTTSPPVPPRNVSREDYGLPSHNQLPPGEPVKDVGRPAWLTQRRDGIGSQPVPQAPPDTLQGSRDRLTSRWFALKGLFDAAAAPVPEVAASSAASRVPVLAVFSLAGGVGKTSLVATLARALSARGERLLLIDTASFGLLPFFFGARDQRPGVLRTFSAPGASGDAPIQTVAIDPDTLEPENINPDALGQEIARQAKSANRVLVDVATASGSLTRRLLRISPQVLVPVVPDMTSVVSVGAIERFFRQHPSPGGRQIQPYYLLNQFDQTQPLHLDVREVLREQLGERLLPFAMRRTSAVSEALAEGMTVIDYAPNSTLVEDFFSLAGWVKTSAVPVSSSFRGVRWSEK